MRLEATKPLHSPAALTPHPLPLALTFLTSKGKMQGNRSGRLAERVEPRGMTADECMASLEALVGQQREQIAQRSADVRDLAERWRRKPQVDGSSMEMRTVHKVIFVATHQW
jgi:hypothetical protein